MEELLKMKVKALEVKVSLMDLAGETIVEAMMSKDKATRVELLTFVNDELAPRVDQIDKTLERIDRNIKVVEILSK